ncbi:MAG TPA: ATP-dependent zinc metalloprotease FtsH [Bacteroidales bacterium]|nr:ATP-dependent zinc metalloprotease FtsH [Bacteroidales bacterium]HQH18545.1 ATP-dependent zinc metalloprotease FtsH [Bacteroidales bacterium]HQI44620.1 ATP-dependent zinc metalloprotease FtsH [Bacteroidales bacterium]
MADFKNTLKQGKKSIPNPNIKKPKGGFNFYWIYGILAVIFLIIQLYSWNATNEKISFQKFEKEMLKPMDVERIVIVNKTKAEIYIKKDSLKKSQYKKINEGLGGAVNPGPHYFFEIGSVEAFNLDLEKAKNNILASDTVGKTPLEKKELIEKLKIPIDYETKSEWGREILTWVFPFILMIVVWMWIMRKMSGGAGGAGGQIFNIGKSKAQLFDKDTSVNINFNDVAGLEEAKVEVMEIVDFLKNPKKYTDLGGKIPKGALLVGPPGTGKTLLAKAVAGEAKVPFFSLSGSDFVEMFVGVGASRVRDLFRQAKEKAPCIIFIDEIDAIGRARGKNAMTGGNDERENTLNQLLTEMDGFGTNVGVIILAATNRADILDRALMRAGRFDRQIHLELPDLEERKAIFKVHVRPLKLDESVDVDFLAKQTPGFSGADIANVCNESALIAARNNKKLIGKQDFLDAVDRIIGGLEKRSKIISKDEKKVIAFHEAGHAAVSWMLKYAHPLIKVTIVPRGKALGAAWYLPEERQITTYDQMLDDITSTLGGRASEDIVFGQISTGALNDLEKVTKQAYAMIVYYGLNKKIGNISYYDSTGASEYAFSKPYSETTANTIDSELSKLIENAYERAKKILIDNRDKLEILAKRLLEKEVIFREDLEEIFGLRPFDEVTENKLVLENDKKEKLVESPELVVNNEIKKPKSGVIEFPEK